MSNMGVVHGEHTATGLWLSQTDKSVSNSLHAQVALL